MKSIESILNFQNPKSDSIPRIPLYMDQLLDYMQSELMPILDPSEENVYTKTMINNYVKAQVIEAPVKKKYSYSAMTELILMYHMKSCFSIHNASSAIAFLRKTSQNDSIVAYQKFTEIYEERQKKIQKELSTNESKERLLLEYIVDISIKKRLVDQILTDSSK